MGTKRVWTDEEIARVKQLMFEGNTFGEIATIMGKARSAVIGIVHREPVLFKDVPRQTKGSRSAGKGVSIYSKGLTRPKPPPRKDTRKRQVSEPSRPPQVVTDNVEELVNLTRVDGAPEELSSKWKQIAKGDKLFVYRGMELEPTFRFTRPCAGANWRGHGVYAMTKGAIFAWVNKQKVKDYGKI